MIRRDYFVEMVQALSQALVRVKFLRQKQESATALEELELTLAGFWNISPGQVGELSLDQWVGLCTEGGAGMGEKMIALADLLVEKGELLENKGDGPSASGSYSQALGLYLESLHRCMVSLDVVSKAEDLLQRIDTSVAGPQVLSRLLHYFEARGAFGRAEDILFQWLDTRDPAAFEAGAAFYDRAGQKSDLELEGGGLPRDELADGRAALEARRVDS